MKRKQPPSPTPISLYYVSIEVKWHDAAGNLLGGPPTDLPADFRITAQSTLGDATCTYSAGSLVCQDSNHSGSNSGLQVPYGSIYTVSETGLPAGWRASVGVGMFPGGGDAESFTHIVANRAPEAPSPSPTPTPLPTSPPAPPASPMPTLMLVLPTSTPAAAAFADTPPRPDPSTPTPSPLPPEPTSTPVPATPVPATLTPVSSPSPTSADVVEAGDDLVPVLPTLESAASDESGADMSP